jgi:carbamoyl-phosphate synthase large subunit
MRKKFLITGAQGDIAQSICKIIRLKYKNKILIDGIDILKSGPSNYIFNKIIQSPKINTNKYNIFINKIFKKYDLIIPTTENEIQYLSKNSKIIDLFPILINKTQITKMFLNKILTHNFLSSNKIFPSKFSVPLNLLKKYQGRFFLKKIYGRGNKNYQLINSKSKFKKLKILEKNTWMAQEFLDDKYDEYTCCVIKLEKFISTIILKRKLSGGTTYYVEIIKNKKIDKALKEIANKIDLVGSINVQLKIKKDKIAIFEINPRFSSTVMMRHMLGFKDCIWWVEFFLNRKKPNKIIIKNKKILKISEERFL